MHTYASLDEFKGYLTDGGNAYGTANDAPMLTLLEGASRRVDGFCARSRDRKSGFGPRTGTNDYDAQGWYGGYTLYRDNMVMDLDDDLLTATTVTVLDSTGGTPTTIVEGTDFYLEPYNAVQKRQLIITGLGQSYIVPGLKIVSITGQWGFQSELVGVAATLGTVGATDTTAVLTDGGVSVGHTIRVGSEDLYVSATTAGTALATAGGTVTVSRGQNGTTAAIHGAGAAISVHRYPREVTTAVIAVAQRRWRSRDAGLTGNFGGAGVPMIGNQDTERSILWGHVGHLRHGSAMVG